MRYPTHCPRGGRRRARPSSFRMVAAAFVATLALGPGASAGGTVYTTVLPGGSWGDSATWDLGVVPGVGAGDEVDVTLPVTVDSAVPFVNIIRLMDTGEFDMQVVDGADLSSNQLTSGLSAGIQTRVEQSGGSLEILGDMTVGLVAESTYSLSGGSLQAGDVNVGGLGLSFAPAAFVVSGSDATVSADSFRIRSNGTLVCRPSADGLAGLTPIATHDLSVENASLVINPTYPAEVGDTWVLFTYTGNLNSITFSSITVGQGMSVSLDWFLPGRVLATVTSSPFPVPGNSCDDPIELQVGVPHTGTFDNATATGPEQSCEIPVVQSDLWFTYTNDGSEPQCLSAYLWNGVSPITNLSFERWDLCGGTLLDCVGNGFVISQEPSLDVVAQPGETVLLRAAYQASGEQQYRIDLFEDGGWTDEGGGSPDSGGVVPVLTGTGFLHAGETFGLELTDGPADSLALAWLSVTSEPIPALGGTVIAIPFVEQFLLGTDAAGALSVSSIWPADVPAGTSVWFQLICLEPGGGLYLSNAVRGETPQGLPF